MLAATRAKLRQLELLCVCPLVLGGRVVPFPALLALQGDNDSRIRGHGKSPLDCCFVARERLAELHDPMLGSSYSMDYSMILVTTPEPTVLPPSRIAKRRP